MQTDLNSLIYLIHTNTPWKRAKQTDIFIIMEINLAAQRRKHLERLHATGSPHKALILILSPRGPFGNHSVFQSKCYFSSLLWRFNWLNLLWSYTANLPSHCTLWDPEKRRWMPYFFLFPVCHPGPHPQMVFGKQQDKVSERRVPLGDSGKLFHAPATAPGVFFTSSSYLSCGRQFLCKNTPALSA